MSRSGQYLGFLLAWAAYSVGSYGVVLLRGWNISPRQWFSPLNPYAWPSDGSDPLCVPAGSLWPTGSGGQACGGSSGGLSSTEAANALEAADAKAQGRPIPGSVASRF